VKDPISSPCHAALEGGSHASHNANSLSRSLTNHLPTISTQPSLSLASKCWHLSWLSSSGPRRSISTLIIWSQLVQFTPERKYLLISKRPVSIRASAMFLKQMYAGRQLMYMQSAGDAECSCLSDRSFAGRLPSMKDSIGKDGFIKRSLSENAVLTSYWFWV